jgi:hypothetical protein
VRPALATLLLAVAALAAVTLGHPVRALAACTAMPADPSTCVSIQPNYNYVPDLNGCGPGDGIASNIIHFFNAFSLANFEPACKNHDACYQACVNDKKQCDDQLRKDMSNACRVAYGDSSKADVNGWCKLFVRGDLFFVQDHGQAAWDADQQLACLCCDCAPCGASSCCNAALGAACCTNYNGSKSCNYPSGKCGACQQQCPTMCCDLATFNSCCETADHQYGCRVENGVCIPGP